MDVLDVHACATYMFVIHALDIDDHTRAVTLNHEITIYHFLGNYIEPTNGVKSVGHSYTHNQDQQNANATAKNKVFG